MKGRAWLTPFLAVLSLLVVAAGVLSFWLYLYAVSSEGTISRETRQVYIPPGSGFDKIQAALVDADVIDDDVRFGLLVRYLGVSRQIKAGEYLFAKGAAPLVVLKELAAGKSVLRQFTIPEGSTIFQVGDILAQAGWVDRQGFLDLVQSPLFLQTLGVGQSSLEGYLFPETYRFPKGEDVRQIIGTMVAQTRRVIAEECLESAFPGFTFNCDPENLHGKVAPKDISQGKRLLGVPEILTLASIVEKETGLGLERPLVAGVFLNRLSSNMKLQADPTVIYGLQKFGLSLSRKDLQTPGPYNTYMIRGLPKGPICNPGRAALAAIFQAKTQYYYFVAQGDGSHYFSKTLKEHNRAVKRYREIMRKDTAAGGR